MIGLGLVAFVAVFAASLKASRGQALDEVLRADLTLSSNQFTVLVAPGEQLRQDPDFSVVSRAAPDGRRTSAGSDTFPAADRSGDVRAGRRHHDGERLTRRPLRSQRGARLETRRRTARDSRSGARSR
jgi:hypothetical protein